jgi:molybdenum cofactor biosynthesis protein B
MTSNQHPPGGGGFAPDRPFLPVKIGVLSISDTRTHANDHSGDALADMITRDGHLVSARKLVRDSVPDIQHAMKAWIADTSIDAIISTGGTGVTGRDVTPEAVRPLFDKEIEGFQTVWHLVSFESVGVSTMQSRACAGIAGATFVFCLPGSSSACRDGWEKIIRWQFDNRHRPCNLVEMIPRLNES